MATKANNQNLDVLASELDNVLLFAVPYLLFSYISSICKIQLIHPSEEQVQGFTFYS